MIGDTLRKLGRQTVIYSTGDLLVKSLSFLLIPIFTRVWPADSPEMGAFGLIHLVEAISYLVFNMGLALAVIKVLADYRHSRARGSVVFTATGLLLTLSLGLLVLGWMVVPYVVTPYFGTQITHEDGTLFLRLTLVATYLSTFRFLTLSLLRVEERPWLYTALNILNFLVYVGMAVYLVVGQRIGVLGVVYANVTASVFMLALCLFLLQARARRPFSGTRAKALLAFGVPLLPNGLALWALALLDRWLLRVWAPAGTLSGIEITGIYDVAYRFGMIVSFLLVVPLRTAWVPTLYQVREHADAPELYGRLITYVFVLGGLIALPLAVLAPELIQVLVAPDYAAAAAVLPLIAFAYLAYGMSQVADSAILAKGRTTVYPVLTLTSVIVNVLLCWLLIPRYGMLGAAWATLGAYVWHSLVIATASWRITPFRIEVRRLLAALVALAAVWSVSRLVPGWSLPGRTAAKLVLIGCYPVILWALGFFSKEEREALARLRGKRPEPAEEVPVEGPEGDLS